jgi:hypothetical protein
VNDGHFVFAMGRNVTIQGIVSDVGLAAYKPLEKRRIRTVQHRIPLLEPVQIFGRFWGSGWHPPQAGAAAGRRDLPLKELQWFPAQFLLLSDPLLLLLLSLSFSTNSGINLELIRQRPCQYRPIKSNPGLRHSMLLFLKIYPVANGRKFRRSSKKWL